jgi:hypothetical protein
MTASALRLGLEKKYLLKLSFLRSCSFFHTSLWTGGTWACQACVRFLRAFPCVGACVFYFPFSFFFWKIFSLSFFKKKLKKCKDTWALTYIWIYN